MIKDYKAKKNQIKLKLEDKKTNCSSSYLFHMPKNRCYVFTKNYLFTG